MSKFLAFVLLVALVHSQDMTIENTMKPLSSEMIDFINSAQSNWVAAPHERFNSLDAVVPLLGARTPTKEQRAPLKEFTPLTDLPKSFDPREQWPNCSSLFEVRDQANCGSCWAFGAVEAMSDRICIASNQTLQTRVSAQDLTSCCEDCGDGCDGGYPDAAWQYWSDTGLVTGDLHNITDQWCKPYALEACDHHVNGTLKPCGPIKGTPKCSHKCQKSYPKMYKADKTFGQSSYSILSSEEHIKTEIFKHGPVECAFTVYGDFPTYKSGVYHHVSGQALGGHAVKLFGWGEENGTPYWLVVNSWNEDWGDKGMFKIRRGSNECGIEESVVAGLPKL